MLELFTDGGCIGPNPSKKGGTWAWCLIDSGAIVRSACGVVVPADVDLPAVTNNITELLAAVLGLEAVGPDFDGIWHTDSKVTVYRLTTSTAFKGCPDWLRKRVLEVRRGRKYKVALLGGHPNKKELASGVRKDGAAVNRWNVWCDKQCCRLAKEWADEL